MIAGWALDILLALMVPVVALGSLLLRGLLPAIAAFIAYGLLLALVWMRLDAPDVALTEAAVGGGVTSVLLLGAATRLKPFTTDPIPSALQRVLVAVLCLAVAGALMAAVFSLPELPPSLASAAASHLPATKLGNPVAGVLLAFRAIDTLLEAVVLVIAVIGIWALAAEESWPGRVGAPQPRAADGPLALLSVLLPPLGILAGVYLAWVGAEEPGGAFQGGSLLAAMWILAWMAGRVEPPDVTSAPLRLAVVAGPVVFFLVGLAGFVVADGFMAYPAGWTKPVILFVEAALTLSIAVALALIVAGWPAHGGVRR